MLNIFTTRLIVAILVIGAFFFYGTERYDFIRDGQAERCLTAQWFIVDTWDRDFTHGDIMVFNFHLDSGPMRVGDKVIKLVGGLPNEVVFYDRYGIETDTGFAFNSNITKGLEAIDYEIDDTNSYPLGSSQYFLVGERPFSFDSRYWGAANKNQIIGKAYAIY